MAPLAPAHRINPAAPGTAYVVDEDGTIDRVRADYWPDDLVRQVAATHPAPVHEPEPADSPTIGHVDPGQGREDTRTGPSPWPVTDLPTGRKPRTPRRPRQGAARTPDPGGEVA